MSEPERKYKPSGKTRDFFDAKATGKFQTDLYNLAYQRDQATKRNKYYIALIAILILVLGYVCMTAKFKTFVVRVNDTTGEISAGQEIKARAYNPKQAEVLYFLRQFIYDTRSVPNDMVVLRKNWTRASHFMTPNAATKYNALANKEGRTIASFHSRMVEPTINTIQLQPGMDRTYQIRWVEEVYNGSGLERRINYSGLFTVVIEPPDKESQLALNPLGVKIGDLTYSKENEKIVSQAEQQASAATPEVPMVEGGGQ